MKSLSDNYVSHYALDPSQSTQPHFTEIQAHEKQIHTREHRHATEIKMMKTKDLALIFYQCQRLGQDGLLQAQKRFTHLSDIYSLPTMYQV